MRQYRYLKNDYQFFDNHESNLLIKVKVHKSK